MSYSRTRAYPLGEFSQQPLTSRFNIHLISTPCLHRALYKIHTWKFCAYGKIKSGRKTLVKNKKRIKNFCQEKKQIPLWKRLVLAELHAGVQISNKEVAVKPKFAIHNVKSEVSFSLYKPLYQNYDKLRVHQSPRIWKAVRGFVVLLFSTVSDFPTSLRDFPLPLATLLIIVMSSSSLHWPCLQWITFPGRSLIHGHWCQEVPLSHRLAVSGGEIISWRGASCLIANLYELKSRIWFWEEYNQFDWFYCV